VRPVAHQTQRDVIVVPLTVMSQTFPARTGSLPDIRAFVNRCLAQAALPGPDRAALHDALTQVLIDASGPAATVQVSCRLLPGHAEVEVLRSPAGHDGINDRRDGILLRPSRQ
jgi:hypothetical protein